MIRRGTWILLLVFVVLAGLAFYLQKNPLSTPQATGTPAPTETALLLEGLAPADITAVERQAPGDTLRLEKNSAGNWVTGADAGVVSVGLVEQALTEITSLRPSAYLDPGIDLEAIGMSAPTATLLLQTTAGSTRTLRIGALTPTGNSYYLQVDDQAPAVVDQFAVDGILGLLQREQLLPQATPSATPTGG